MQYNNEKRREWQKIGKNVYYIAGNDYFLETIFEAEQDYNIEDLYPDDVVLDIGAFIGGFTLRIARNVKHVYAVEPLWHDLLQMNLEINKIENVTIIPKALGAHSARKILTYYHRSAIVKFKTLQEIKNECGVTIDFLKCDCEGCEKHITPIELNGIQRIEMEIHPWIDVNSVLINLNKGGFYYNIDKSRDNCIIVHGYREEK